MRGVGGAVDCRFCGNEGWGGRLRGFVRIRIFGIGGIFRISLARFAVFAMIGIRDETNACERLANRRHAGRILKIL